MSGMQKLPDATNDLRGAVAILRTAQHVDAIRILADAIDRAVSDPDAPSLEEMLGLKRPGMSRKRSDIRRLIVSLAGFYSAKLAAEGGGQMPKSTMATYIIQEAKRREAAYYAYRDTKVLPASEPDLSLVLLMATHGGKRTASGLSYTPDMQTIASYIEADA